MKRFFFLVSAMLLAACGGPTPFPKTATPPQAFAIAPSLEDATAHQHVYWTLFAGSAYPQVEIANVPLKKSSHAVNIFNNSHNGLLYSNGMHVDNSGRLWILSFGQGKGAPGDVSVFKLPLTSSSSPLYTFVLSGTSDADHLTFDASGNLWVTSYLNSKVFEYHGPFTKSGKLSPKITLTNGFARPSGIALDKKGNLYISNFAFRSSGRNSIAIFTKPISNKQPRFLEGLTAPGGLIFDRHGNLYASNNTGSLAAVVRYNSNDLKPGDTPSIIDSSGLNGAYEADFAFTATGDLYFANCGATGPNSGIDVYPTSKKPFSSKLAPSVVYTNSYITGAHCAWGITIK